MPIFLSPGYWFLNEVSKKINSNQQIGGSVCQISGLGSINQVTCHSWKGGRELLNRLEEPTCCLRDLSLVQGRDGRWWRGGVLPLLSSNFKALPAMPPLKFPPATRPPKPDNIRIPSSTLTSLWNAADTVCCRNLPALKRAPALLK